MDTTIMGYVQYRVDILIQSKNFPAAQEPIFKAKASTSGSRNRIASRGNEMHPSHLPSSPRVLMNDHWSDK